MQTVIATRPVEHWNAALNEVGIPCSPINTLAQLLAHPHTKANKLIMQYEHAAAGQLNCVGHPVTFVGEERSAGLPPPMLGQGGDQQDIDDVDFVAPPGQHEDEVRIGER